MCHRVLCLILISVSTASFAQISTLSISSDQKFSAPRWMFDNKAKIKSSKLIALMVQARKAELDKNPVACVNALNQAQGLQKSLAQWFDLASLRCALIPDKKGAYSQSALLKSIAKLENHLRWLVKSTAAGLLRTNYSKALLILAEDQLKTNRHGAWSTIDKLEQFKESLTAEDRANMYRIAGELAFVEQNLLATQDFLSRSLMEKDSPELRARLESVRTTLQGKRDDKAVVDQLPPPTSPADLGVSAQEQNLFDRMKVGIRAQDYIPAVEDAMGLITKFPGGVRAAEATDKVLEIYLSIAANGDEKYRHLLQRVVHLMNAADSGRLLRWAQAAYNRSYYQNALEFSENAFEKLGGHPDSTKALLLAGKSALASGEYTTAEDDLEKLTTRAAGSKEASEALFRIGLLKYRRAKYSEAVAFFERVLALNPNGDYEYRSLYWEWRSLQKLNNDRAKEYVQRLLDRYPVTYYGLRAQSEGRGGNIEFPLIKGPIKIELRLLESERLHWERFLVLLEAGWFEEAQAELQNLPEPQSMQERILRARLWALAFRYDRAISLANRAWEKAPDLVLNETLTWVYPLEFSNLVTASSEKQKLHPFWIYSVMRQESSFQTDAKSTSNALGLMQLLPATAQQLADELKIPKFKSPESLLLPDINIRLGSTYLARMISTFKGNVPLALAAYNAGPARLKRWLSARKDLDGLETKQTSNPDVEIWMDELPWDETSFYVKAILRNFMIYRYLDQGPLKVQDPVWKS
jgi:soluble lytic murein transglycosylase